MSRIRLALIAGPAVLLLAACSSPQAATTSPTPSTPAVATPTTTAPAAAPAAATAGLSGTWSGQYSGAYQGTFTLTWQQSASNLSGTIKLSAPAGTISIHGTVKGSAIRFGTVGSVGITYSGSVSGNSMSGTYQVQTANGPTGGPWSASRAS
jgi:hypothetical protein